MRRRSRNFYLGNVPVGSDHPVTVQSMCNTRTSDAVSTLEQIRRLAGVGCEIIRLSVDNDDDARALEQITAEAPIPVIADIQFASDMAVKAMIAGVAGVRINPGIVRDREALRSVAATAAELDVPIRVGANAGSLPRHEIEERLKKMDYVPAVADALCTAALEQCEALEKFGVRKIKVALKSSDVGVTLAACRKFAGMTDYPLHLGITEAGIPARGIVKSAVALGALLLDGIGDTIRVSLTSAPEAEVEAGIRILESCQLRPAVPEIVSCPTCGRTEIDLIALAEQVESEVRKLKSSGKRIALRKIAVMGCPVNGPGEARDADLGIAGSRSGQLVIFRRGKVLCSASAGEAFAIFAGELEREEI